MSNRRPHTITVGGKAYPARVRIPTDFVLSDEAVELVEEAGKIRSDEYISDPSAPNKAVTRRILRPEYVPVNTKDASATIGVTLMHQRRRPKPAAAEEEWEDADSFSLATVRADEQVRLQLSCGETKRLYLALTQLYAKMGTLEAVLRDGGVTATRGTDVTIVRGKVPDYIRELVEESDEEVVRSVAELRPSLVEAAAFHRQREARKKALAEFESKMASGEWSEQNWQDFFEEQTWIFGHSLVYQFVSTVGDQAYVGGKIYTRKGEQRTDMLLATEAQARFTVLVDIKKPDTPLVKNELYRNYVHPLGEEITGGVSQLQSYCRRWVIEGSQQEDGREMLNEAHIYTYEPRAILIAGNTAQLDSASKRATFEMFRRNLRNPEMITYDELLQRARFTLELSDLHEGQ
jgi:hypothetical protein